MNNFRDTRLIEAFEYIDPKYINEVGAGLKLRSVYSAEKEHSKPTLRTHVKQLATLAACVLLLSLVIPLFGYVGNLIADFAAGHAGTTEDLPYLVYSPDVEPLSQELMDEMNEKYIQCFLKMSKEELIAEYGENYVEELDHLWLFGYWDPSCTAYYGTFGDCIVVATVNSTYGDDTIIIAGYKIITHTYVYHCPTKTMYQIDAAYAMGLIDNDDIELIPERHKKCMQQGREDKTTDATRSEMTEDVSDVIESTEPSQTSNPNFQYSTVRIISDNNAFINPISVKIGYSLYKDDKSIWTEEIAGWQYIISNKDYKFENLPILTLDGDISSSAPENVSISNFQIFDSDWQRLDYTFAHLYELSLLPSGDYIVVGIEKEMIQCEQPHYVVGEYDYKLESSAAVFALSVTKQIELKKKLNYLKFIPELESIDDRIMHDVKNAWAEFRRNGSYTSNYQNYLYNGYTDNEAKTLAEKDANRAAEYAFPQFFDGSYFYYFGYLGILDESIVLASYSGTGNVKDVVIGGVDFGFKARFFIYTDGKIISLEEAYDEKIISGDELLIIKKRNEQYIESAYDYYIIDDEQALEQ